MYLSQTLKLDCKLRGAVSESHKLEAEISYRRWKMFGFSYISTQPDTAGPIEERPRFNQKVQHVLKHCNQSFKFFNLMKD